MLIQLRQAEIIEAIKGYVIKQGINLTGKAVDVAFTAGRKESGLSADINIEDAGTIPDLFSDEDGQTTGASLHVVKNDQPVNQAPVDEPAPEVKIEEAAPKATTSLFG